MSPMMKPLRTLDDLDAAIAGSSTRPALVFKHSTTCGTSAYAHEEVESLLEEPDLRAEVYIVDVRAARPVSTAIAERSGIRHESPQALLFVNGQVVWHASHFRLTRDTLAAAITAAG
jgi:bacillithiol system protein YtxJ